MRIIVPIIGGIVLQMPCSNDMYGQFLICFLYIIYIFVIFVSYILRKKHYARYIM